MGKGAQWLLLTTIVATIATMLFVRYRQEEELKSGLMTRMQGIVRSGEEADLSCSQIAETRPLVVLALGQSNAANHGSLDRRDQEPLTMIAEGRCIRATDPLPGATGLGGSIWQRLPAAWREQHPSRPIVVSLLAVDASSIAEWTQPDSALRQRLVEDVESLRRLDLLPDFILWQQGEADARNGTSSRDYSQGLDALAAIIDAAGAHAPIIVARSTICRSVPNHEVRSAIASRASTDHRFRLGPDTDVLSGNEFRHDGCHLTVGGLVSAARMWAASISAEASRTVPSP